MEQAYCEYCDSPVKLAKEGMFEYVCPKCGELTYTDVKFEKGE